MRKLGGRGSVVGWVACLAVTAATWGAPGTASAATRFVDNTGLCLDLGSCLGPVPCCTIQFAIDASVSGADTIEVGPGTYPENLTLAIDVTLRGNQAGNLGCDRIDVETIVAPAAGAGLTLSTGAGGSTIDGFTFSGATRGIQATSGPVDALVIRNTRFVGFTESGVFLDAPANDLVFELNAIDGTDATGPSGLFHLNDDHSFDGLVLDSNCIANGTATYGFFANGDHNVGPSIDQGPLLMIANSITNNLVGVHLGARAVDGGTISGNFFIGNLQDGLQGGPQGAVISGNEFAGNGVYGLHLTSFGDPDPGSGAQLVDVFENCFSANGVAGIFYSDTQAANTIDTVTTFDNNIYGNAAGAIYGGSENVVAENNYWGCPTGANTAGCDTASAAIDVSPFLATPNLNAPCDPLAGPTETPTPAITPTPTGAPVTSTPTPSTTPSPTAPTTPTVTGTPTATTTGTPVATTTVTGTPVVTGTPTATITGTPVATATVTGTPVVTGTPTATITGTPVVTASATGTPVVTGTATPTPSATVDDTPAPTITATVGTPVATATATSTATGTATPSITSTDPATPTATPTPGDLDHFQCYETHRPPLRLAPLSLVDRFGASTARLIRGKRFCAPASKNDEDPDAVSALDHLTGYTIKQTTPRFAPLRDVPVTNQFGTIEVDLVRPDYLLVPTGKSHVGPLPSYTAGIDHYKCYKARGRFRTGPVAIEDQFGSIVAFIKRAVRLCVPVDKNDEGVIDPITSVLCYSTRAAAGAPTGDTLYTLNQFGPDSFDVFGARELCVPSTLP